MAWSGFPRGAVEVHDGHWSPRLEMNRERAMIHQWDRYEAVGTIDNFRILAGLKEGERRGYFYADSDLHKWADAASRILESGPDEGIEARLREYLGLMAACQAEDGYLFTYNQLLFPDMRWKNLQLEHELYCHGHFIEAGVSHFEATGRRELLDLAEKAARLIVREFRDAPAERTSGHEEIELALIRLYRATNSLEYLETARNLLERRGTIRAFGAKFLGQLLSHAARSRAADRRGAGKGRLGFEFGGNLAKREPPFIMLRSLPLFFGGAYQQQDKPMREQVEPKGHAVRWAYLLTAAAMLYRERPDPSLMKWMEAAWDSLVGKKMYVTGGIGSLPVIEGFGRPYELDNRYSYSETCAAIGSLLWNREMSLATGEARYADLVEWQLENAASVGISLAGEGYFYRNPLSADGELERRPWYATACCPSNISRLWAELPALAYARGELSLRIDQYLGSRAMIGGGFSLSVESGLPWEGRVRIEVEGPLTLDLRLRIPGWANRARLSVGGSTEKLVERAGEPVFGVERFGRAEYVGLKLRPGKSVVDLEIPMEISPLRAAAEVRSDRGRVAVTRGALVYCAESIDNPGMDLERLELDATSLAYAWDASLFPGGCGTILGKTSEGRPLKLLPYCYWGNRGRGSMRVWLRLPARSGSTGSPSGTSGS